MMMKRALKGLPLALAFFAAPSAQSQGNDQNTTAANQGYYTDQGHDPAWHLAQFRAMTAAMSTLKPQRPGVVDAYVIVAGLDSDAVFGKEATEAAQVLSRRYDAVGRTILLSTGSPKTPAGTPTNLAATLAAVAGRMNLKEDVLVLYTTSHGAPGIGLAYKDEGHGIGMIAPARLSAMLDSVGITRRLIMISACYSGQFIGPLATRDSIIIAAADDNRTSFGCAPGNDWTFFGDALINNALRKPQPFEPAIAEALGLISGWEFSKSLTESRPRSFIGDQAKIWLTALEKRMPVAATAKVGRPAIEDDLPANPH